MVCVPGGSDKRFIGGDAPFEMPSTTILPHGLMSREMVPDATTAAGAVLLALAEGSNAGATTAAAVDATAVPLMSVAAGATAATGASATGTLVGAVDVEGADTAGVSVFASLVGGVESVADG